MKHKLLYYWKLITSISLLFILFAIVSCGNKKQESKKNSRPNILFIMSDDHGYQAISAYGHGLNKTPNIDRLAESGVRFSNSFVTNSICAPSRAVIQTGTYSHINGVIDNRVVLDTNQVVFPELLQKSGYQTALFGKWHLKSSPTGFDYWNILPGQGNYYNPDFIEMGKKTKKKGYVTDLITDICLTWLDKRDTEKPFFITLYHKAPHRNWMPDEKHMSMYENEDIPMPKTYYDDYETRSAAAKEQEMQIAKHMFLDYDMKYLNYKYDNKGPYNKKMMKASYGRLNEEQKGVFDSIYGARNKQFDDLDLKGKDLSDWKYQRYIKDYLRCIASVDDNIGRVLDYLDENGLTENTIIVYTSDQGFYLGEHGWFDKRFMYEQSLRTPLIVKYPKEIKPAVNDSDMVLNLDFAPTLLDYAGVEVPESFQGKSFRKILSGNTPKDWRQSIYYHYYMLPGWHSVKKHYGIRTKQYKLIHFYYDIDAWELYDLKNDPDEVNNIYDNPDYKETIIDLKKQLLELRTLYNDTTGTGFTL